MAPEPIQLFVSNQRAFVWSPEDVTTLRTTHRICGALRGTLPHLAQQNVFLGLPLTLLPEEVVLLVEDGAAVIVDDALAHTTPRDAQLAAWERARVEDATRQEDESRARTQAEHAAREAALDDAARAKRAARGARKTGAGEPLPPPPDAAPTHFVAVPGASSALPWHVPARATHTTLASARAAGVWVFPASRAERARAGVFRALWTRGHFLGSALKFGGDFLVYPGTRAPAACARLTSSAGDPLRYHSHFVASVLDAPNTPLRPMEIVAHGRLGTGTKKAHLLCTWDDDAASVTFFSVEWSGFG